MLAWPSTGSILQQAEPRRQIGWIKQQLDFFNAYRVAQSAVLTAEATAAKDNSGAAAAVTGKTYAFCSGFRRRGARRRTGIGRDRVVIGTKLPVTASAPGAPPDTSSSPTPSTVGGAPRVASSVTGASAPTGANSVP